ncbi:MAG: hypothetical protein H6Q90_4906 [Deltaproteobacteria bacterium]|nr:hypothetical protein [Deltaproteobacteria bacterium]
MGATRSRSGRRICALAAAYFASAAGWALDPVIADGWGPQHDLAMWFAGIAGLFALLAIPLDLPPESR